MESWTLTTSLHKVRKCIGHKRFWKLSLCFLSISGILLYMCMYNLVPLDITPKQGLAGGNFSMQDQLSRNRKGLRHIASPLKMLHRQQQKGNKSIAKSIESKLTDTYTSLSTGSKHIEEVKVKGNTTKDWCSNLKFHYPLPMDINQNEDKLGNISARFEVLNPYSATLIFNPKHLCASSKYIYLITIVKSKVTNTKLRQAIRQTWGREASSGDNRLAFSLGYTTDRSIQKLVEDENSAFKDIIQGDFIDNYYNNSLKTIMRIQWISKFCSSARFVLFVDDDVMVNFQNVLSFYKSVTAENEKSLFSGQLKLYESPHREKDSKWLIPLEDYPYDCFPNYIAGGATLTSGFVVRMLNKVIPYVVIFKLDDVFLGILLQKLGIRPQNNNKVTMFFKKSAYAMKRWIASHWFDEANDYIETYRKMVS